MINQGQVLRLASSPVLGLVFKSGFGVTARKLTGAGLSLKSRLSVAARKLADVGQSED